MQHTHYEVLGIKPTATRAEIRSAYRKLVLIHHPDRSSDPRSKEFFLKISDAYEVLSDEESKQRYDDRIAFEAIRAREEAAKKAEEARQKTQAARQKEERQATPTGATVAEEIIRLQSLYGSGRHNEAEKLAHVIMQIDPRQAIPYAVVADILRAKGFLNEASTMYAYAAQMDPRNPVYQRRYEALLRSARIVEDKRSTRLEAQEKRVIAPLVGGSFAVLSGLFVAFSPEAAITGKVAFISSWTAGLFVSLFLSGVAIGAGMSVGNLLDRMDSMSSSSSGRSGPTVVLGIVAIVNYWVSALLYVFIALGLKAFNFSTSRLMGAVAAATIFFTFASMSSHVVQPAQTLLWGGNLIYLGAMVGWMAADAHRP